ncbi:hypothetical protein E4O05_01230 [Treponema sp. OMZ 787]|uniref:hypothetical protein n=1 Tax=Treponema sp. OMZ 787 TaxID=2563669 RepID=UPI0020A50009|nr:hypothetical protein [Treponema sp. OMZ 787]UTC62566.1 hypothetical protein E4O05_01230 [Treponema sp. OMZ 787]
MKTTNEAYELLQEKLSQIETAANEGLYKEDPCKSCMEIKSLVFETRQVLNENFYISGNEA